MIADLIAEKSNSDKIDLYKEATNLHLQRIKHCQENTETIYTIIFQIESYEEIKKLETENQEKYDQELILCYNKAIELATRRQ
jgi:hypothetical protein